MPALAVQKGGPNSSPNRNPGIIGDAIEGVSAVQKGGHNPNPNPNPNPHPSIVDVSDTIKDRDRRGVPQGERSVCREDLVVGRVADRVGHPALEAVAPQVVGVVDAEVVGLLARAEQDVACPGWGWGWGWGYVEVGFSIWASMGGWGWGWGYVEVGFSLWASMGGWGWG